MVNNNTHRSSNQSVLGKAIYKRKEEAKQTSQTEKLRPTCCGYAIVRRNRDVFRLLMRTNRASDPQKQDL
jgi:hypothetical protein